MLPHPTMALVSGCALRGGQTTFLAGFPEASSLQSTTEAGPSVSLPSTKPHPPHPDSGLTRVSHVATPSRLYEQGLYLLTPVPSSAGTSVAAHTTGFVPFPNCPFQ